MNPITTKSESHFYNFTHEKAGMQGLDREKIDQIIYEASKNSDFYRHQQEMSKSAEEKVHSMQNQIKQELNKGPAYVSLLTEKINKKLNEYESERIMSETWIHIDMDMFYAQVEIRDNPDLGDKPIAVGDHSMISTANYIARTFGVRSAMPGFIGKKLCPELVFVKPNFSKYRVDGEKVREIFKEFDPDFESMGLDEGHLRVTEVLINLDMNHDEGRMKLAKIIREKIFESTRLTASAGIACNKVLAKIATDMGKPNGQFLVPFERNEIIQFMASLKVRKIPGIGKVLEKMLNEFGVFECQDIFKKKLDLFIAFSESTFSFFARAALGIGQVFHSEQREDQKSVSVSKTFRATDSREGLVNMLKVFAKDVSDELTEKQASAKCFSVSIKNFRFESKVKSETLSRYIHKADEVFNAALNIFSDFDLKEKVRLLGLRASSLIYHRPGILEEILGKAQETEKPKVGVKVKEQKCPICNKSFLYTDSRMQVHIDQCMQDDPVKTVKKGRKRTKAEPSPMLTLDKFYKKK